MNGPFYTLGISGKTFLKKHQMMCSICPYGVAWIACELAELVTRVQISVGALFFKVTKMESLIPEGALIL